MFSWLQLIVISVIVSLLLFRSASKTGRTRDAGPKGKYGGGSRYRVVVEYGTGLRLFSIIFLWMMSGLFSSAFDQTPENREAGIAITGFFLLLAIHLFLQACFLRVEFDDTFIYTQSIYRWKRKIPWADVTGHRFSHILGYLIISTGHHGNIYLPRYLAGLDSFQDALDK